MDNAQRFVAVYAEPELTTLEDSRTIKRVYVKSPEQLRSTPRALDISSCDFTAWHEYVEMLTGRGIPLNAVVTRRTACTMNEAALFQYERLLTEVERNSLQENQV